MKQTEKLLKAAILAVTFLSLCVALYGISREGGRSLTGFLHGKADPLGIERIYVGAWEGKVSEEKGTWYIDLTVDEDFSFQKAAVNLELPEGAAVSGDTNCLLTELGGQYMVNLGVQDAALTITDGTTSRDYRFRIDIR